MPVIIRNNFNWDQRPPPPDDPITINRYSALMVLVLRRARDIAERHSHHVVRVEHFIEALLAEPDARLRLSALGYEDNGEVRAQRFQLLARPTFPAGEVPADALRYSDCLKVWLQAAQQVAERREPELHTIIVDDFIAAAREDPDLRDDELKSLQLVLTKYRKRSAPVLFRAEVTDRFDQVDREIEESHRDTVDRVEAVGRKVDGVSTQDAGVRLQVAGEKTDTTVIREDTAALRALLPAELRLSSLLLMIVMLAATVSGACVGLLTRWQWGGL